MPSLAELAEEAAAAAVGTTVEAADDRTMWSLGGRPFAVLAGDTIEFRLDPIIGVAARRTPDTASSVRGDDWVAFRPSLLDRFAEDRIRAWFAAAHRRAGT